MKPHERETVLTINDGDDMVSIWTCRRTDITALSKKVQPVETGTHKDGTVWARFEIPKQGFSVSRGIKAVRTLSEEQREALSKRMKDIQSRKEAA